MTTRPNLNLLLALRTAGYRQRHLAAKLGISEGYLSHIIAGRKPALPPLRRELARALKTPEQELFPQPR